MPSDGFMGKDATVRQFFDGQPIGEREIVLHFDVAEGRQLDTKIIGQALIDWACLITSAAAAIDPLDNIRLEIVGVSEGSTRFPQLLTFLERSIENVSNAWDQYPYIKKAALGSAHTFFAASIGGLIASSLTPTVQKVELSDTDREMFADMQAKIEESTSVQSLSKRFYRTLESDPELTGVGVAQEWNAKPKIIIPRAEFSERSGLWVPENIEPPAEQTKKDVWDVVLTKPALKSTPQTWTFSRDGLPFNAKMHDAQFLAAVKDGRVPITIQEGVVMRVEVEYREKLHDQIWEFVPGSRRITKVISPAPSAIATPLPFPNKP